MPSVTTLLHSVTISHIHHQSFHHQSYNRLSSEYFRSPKINIHLNFEIFDMATVLLGQVGLGQAVRAGVSRRAFAAVVDCTVAGTVTAMALVAM